MRNKIQRKSLTENQIWSSRPLLNYYAADAALSELAQVQSMGRLYVEIDCSTWANGVYTFKLSSKNATMLLDPKTKLVVVH
jgi:hypothetical protein